MKEFAGRTHQSARHDLARDYIAPEIEAAAVPIRVERRRTATGIELPHRRHRLGRPTARRSPGDPLWRRWSVDAVFDLSRSGLVCHVVALGVPVAAGKTGQARHLPARPRHVCSAAPPRLRLLHAGSDYLNVSGLAGSGLALRRKRGSSLAHHCRTRTREPRTPNPEPATVSFRPRTFVLGSRAIFDHR